MRALFVLALVLTGCSFEARSDSYACPQGNECGDGRVCINSWCVLPGSEGDPDGDLVCPDECSFCDGSVCVMECSGSGSCSSGVTCPPGRACRVDCTGAGSCSGFLDCSEAESCTFDCSGTGACGSQILCGAGACDVSCTGVESCRGGLDCDASCQCNTLCPGGDCGPNLCPGPNPCKKNGLCTSEPGTCQRC